ncbi:ABC transporter permease [Citrobacter koseri]|uniref:ABC transporter permease n=1 Tax=Citrobacter koseri TaxID=545 RepID=UPI0035247042
MIIQAWLWVLDNQPLFWQAVWQHLMMCGLALSIALIIAIPTGVLIANIPRLAFIITSGASTLRTIPSLAILAAVMPFLGIGLLPSVVALVVLAVPPILLNTCTSIQSVNPDTLSAAHGMGLTPWQVTGKIVPPPYRLSAARLWRHLSVAAVWGILSPPALPSWTCRACWSARCRLFCSLWLSKRFSPCLSACFLSRRKGLIQ